MLSENLQQKLKTIGLGRDNFMNALHCTDVTTFETTLELLEAQGLKIIEKSNRFFFETAQLPLHQVTFCIVDIEVNGMDLTKHQIIEIGAVKYRNGRIIDTFESLVQCHSINELISELTSITADMTLNAPKLCDVMNSFKLFLGSAIFVAHDIKFDYNYISKSMEKCLLETLLNPSLCSIKLAERTISSYKYGLKFLNETLELYNDASHHRALSDALTTTKLFELLLKKIPKHIRTFEDLHHFSENAKRMKRDKFHPKILEIREKEREEKRKKDEEKLKKINLHH